MGGSVSKIKNNLNMAHSDRLSRGGISISAMTEEEIEEMDREKAMNGLAADLVLVYPIESKALLEDAAKEGEEPADDFVGKMKQKWRGVKVKYTVNEKILKQLNDRLEHRAELMIKLGQAGLTTVLSRSLDGKSMYLKVWATHTRLVQEATRQEMEMRVDDKKVDSKNIAMEEDGFLERTIEALGLNKLSEFLFGKDETPRVYRDFDPEEADDFMRKNGRLFGSLERQRLIYAILEGAEDVGGAQQDLDGLVADKALSDFVWPHSSEKDDLWCAAALSCSPLPLSPLSPFSLPSLPPLSPSPL